MTPEDKRMLSDAQAEHSQRVLRGVPHEDALHISGEDKPPREINAETLKFLAEKRRKETAEFRRRQRAYVIADRIVTLARDCGPRLLNPATLKQSDYRVYAGKPQQELVDRIHDEYLDAISERLAAGDGIILCGKPGTGKDHLCVAVARHAIITCEVDARWLDGKVFGEIALDMVKGGGDRLKDYVACKVLVLSDPVIPGETLKPYQYDAMWRLLNTRYLNKRSTFITSNCASLDELETCMGSAMLDRMKHGALKHLCNWKTYRGLE